MPLCLMVVDGADLKRIFPLPLAGRFVVGKAPAYFDITFNDFYLEKSHCALNIADDGVTVEDTSHERGIFINGKKIIRNASLSAGDVLRVGNTYLRLDPFDGPAPEGSGEHSTMPSLPELHLHRLGDLQGHTLGHYELGMVLGKGNHGATFRARDVKEKKTIALKVLAIDFPDSRDELIHFAQTIKASAALAAHPHLVSWYGAGKSGPYVWIAQELVDGENLMSSFSHPETARHSWRGAWRLAWEIGQALDHLHRRYAHHGNITGPNILIGANGEVKLNDFRLREALQGSVLQRAVMEEKFVAELPYIAPEKLEEGTFVDEPIADIYSLGVATYVRLSNGKLPFAGTDSKETIQRILIGANDKHRRKAPQAPDDFLDVIYKMLSRSQEDRYQTASQLLSDLEPFNEGR